MLWHVYHHMVLARVLALKCRQGFRHDFDAREAHEKNHCLISGEASEAYPSQADRERNAVSFPLTKFVLRKGAPTGNALTR
jgi:hypothetical protein